MLLLQVPKDGIQTFQIVLPVLREELPDSVLVEVLLHESRLFDEFALHLLDRWEGFWLLLT
jgi:hypothetical protein